MAPIGLEAGHPKLVCIIILDPIQERETRVEKTRLASGIKARRVIPVARLSLINHTMSVSDAM
jgi:hypothetical protein